MGREGDTLIDRPPLVEVSPGHFVEACPLCADVKRPSELEEPATPPQQPDAPKVTSEDAQPKPEETAKVPTVQVDGEVPPTP